MSDPNNDQQDERDWPANSRDDLSYGEVKKGVPINIIVPKPLPPPPSDNEKK